MTYINKKTSSSFEKAVKRVIEESKKEGFSVLTEIDVQSVLRNELDVDFKNYVILGVFNPSIAYNALKEEDKAGTMLPSIVIVQRLSDNRVEIAAIDPIASLPSTKNEYLVNIACEIRFKLEKVIENI